jgi:type VI protein secretion system component Hcp
MIGRGATTMTTQPENKDKAEQKVSKDELSEKELEKATGGKVTTSDIQIKKYVDKSSPLLF